MFKGFIGDFKTFLQRGNVIDLAVAFVIGTAFSAIVTALVGDIIMPPIGLLLDKVDFSNLYVILKEGSTPGPYLTLAAAKKAGAVTLNYGLFIMSLISFLSSPWPYFPLSASSTNSTQNLLRRFPPKAAPIAFPPSLWRLRVAPVAPPNWNPDQVITLAKPAH